MFKIIPKVFSIRIRYKTETVVTAARIRMALGFLTRNDREKLLLEFGTSSVDCFDLDLIIIATESEVRVEDATDTPKQLKIFAPEKIDKDVAIIVAKYILASYGVSID